MSPYIIEKLVNKFLVLKTRLNTIKLKDDFISTLCLISQTSFKTGRHKLKTHFHVSTKQPQNSHANITDVSYLNDDIIWTPDLEKLFLQLWGVMQEVIKGVLEGIITSLPTLEFWLDVIFGEFVDTIKNLLKSLIKKLHEKGFQKLLQGLATKSMGKLVTRIISTASVRFALRVVLIRVAQIALGFVSAVDVILTIFGFVSLIYDVLDPRGYRYEIKATELKELAHMIYIETQFLLSGGIPDNYEQDPTSDDDENIEPPLPKRRRLNNDIYKQLKTTLAGNEFYNSIITLQLKWLKAQSKKSVKKMVSYSKKLGHNFKTKHFIKNIVTKKRVVNNIKLATYSHKTETEDTDEEDEEEKEEEEEDTPEEKWLSPFEREMPVQISPFMYDNDWFTAPAAGDDPSQEYLDSMTQMTLNIIHYLTELTVNHRGELIDYEKNDADVEPIPSTPEELDKLLSRSLSKFSTDTLLPWRKKNLQTIKLCSIVLVVLSFCRFSIGKN
jgi:hypothetical protein